ncbi:MAG: dTMP kinase [Syntrophobacterales bacterium]|nr:dTMP kinase [Syntrophobacterales bacterium]
MAPGFLIALEGMDGAGKSTQARLLAQALAERGYEVLLTREPSDAPLGVRLRQYLVGGGRRLPPELELAWFMADRREHVARVLAPALAAGKVVVSDRSYYSSAAYQGARGLDPEAIIALNETFAPRPDVVFLLLLPVAEALRRRPEAKGLWRRGEVQSYLGRVSACYERLQGPHLVRLDARLPLEAVHHQLVALTLAALRRAGLFPTPGIWEGKP